jgi:ABC-type sugar transport system ATPase subunit
MTTGTTPTTTLLRATGLVKQYGHVRALDGADFDVDAGDRV